MGGTSYDAPNAFWISVTNLLGLACVVGVLLLFYFALPNQPKGEQRGAVKSR
jgi:hypothetical protein